MRRTFEFRKDGFKLYAECYKPIACLSLEQKGKLLDLIFKYQLGEEVTPDSDVALAFGFFVSRFEYDDEKYLATCNQNRENIKKRWNTTEYDRIRPNTNRTDRKIDRKTEEKGGLSIGKDQGLSPAVESAVLGMRVARKEDLI